MKSKIVLGIVVTGAVSVYALFAKNVFVQAHTKGYVDECAMLLASDDTQEIKQYLNEMKHKEDEVKKSDAVASIIGNATSDARTFTPMGMGTALKECLPQLKMHLGRIESQQKITH